MKSSLGILLVGLMLFGVGFGTSSGTRQVVKKTVNSILHRILVQDLPDSISADGYEYPKEKKRLETLFAARGSTVGYDYFRKAYQMIGAGTVHNLAHWVGNELYRREGIQGVALCDGSYQFGCFHGFFGAALGTEGRGILPKIEVVCMRSGQLPFQFGGCIHGIGHGVLGLRGYKREDLIQALKDCDLLSNQSSREGCYNGVFMEYNIRTMQGINGNEIVLRTLDSAHPFDPCDALGPAYQSFCFYEQPAWWTTAGNQSVAHSATWCALLSNARNQDECFRGLGRMILNNTNGNAEQIVRQCAEFPGDGVVACMSESVRLLLSQGDKTSWKYLCESLEDSAALECSREAKTFLCSSFSQCE